jgi:hypothetical protein
VMPRWLRILRWALVLPAAVAGILLAIALVFEAWLWVGGAFGYCYAVGFIVVTTLAAVLGALTAPPDQRTLASRVIVGVICAVAILYTIGDVLNNSFGILNVYEWIGLVLGSLIALRAFRATQTHPQVLSSP